MVFLILQVEGGGGQAAELGLMHVGGVFVVLLMGMSIACIIAFFEHYFEKRKRQRKPISVCKIVNLFQKSIFIY
jgi:hypothetical protein